jgi:23S rRNA (uracil1939-C5)-methyltransferase
MTAAVACPHHPDCPGCPWVGRAYADQLHSKRQRVTTALAAAFPDGAPVVVEPVVAAAEATGYRVQAKLMVGATRRGAVLGLYAPGSHRLLDVSCCPLHDPLLQSAIPAVRDALAAESVPFHGKARPGLRYVLLRASVAESRVLVTLVSSLVPLPRAPRLARRLRATIPLAGLLLNENTTTGNVILGTRTERIWGESTLRERYGDVTLAAGPTAFVQANARMATRIYRAIADAIDSTIADAIEPAIPDAAESTIPTAIATGAASEAGPRVLDLYCGIGGIALTVARRAASVIGIEEVDAAVVAARANAERNEVAHARFVTGRVEEVLAAHDEPVDVVTLNPPRKGCAPRVVDELGRLAPSLVLYLSCSPASFARDAALLARAGFALASVQPFDLLPQTDHVELLGTFRRSSKI